MSNVRFIAPIPFSYHSVCQEQHTLVWVILCNRIRMEIRWEKSPISIVSHVFHIPAVDPVERNKAASKERKLSYPTP